MSRRIFVNWGFATASLVCAAIAGALIWGGSNLVHTQPDVASATCNGEPMSAIDRCVVKVNGSVDSSQSAEEVAEEVAEASADTSHFWGWVVIALGGLACVFAIGAATQAFSP